MKNGSSNADAINAAHGSVEQARRDGVGHAMECGRLLLEAKAAVAQEQWESWVSGHCSFSPQTARLYMKVASWVGDDPEKAQRAAGLSLREIAREIAKPRLDDVLEKLGLFARSPEAREWPVEKKEKFVKTMRWWTSAKPETRKEFVRRLQEKAVKQGIPLKELRLPSIED